MAAPFARTLPMVGAPLRDFAEPGFAKTGSAVSAVPWAASRTSTSTMSSRHGGLGPTRAR